MPILACGSTGQDDPGAGGSAGTAGSNGAGGAGANPAGCPAQAPSLGGDGKCDTDGTRCSYPMACQSGSAEFSFTCKDGIGGGSGVNPPLVWKFDNPDCRRHDECTGQVHCSEAGKWMPPPNPATAPQPCPSKPPAQGTACTNADSAKCGYECQDSAAWTVATCEPNGQWTYDGNCS